MILSVFQIFLIVLGTSAVTVAIIFMIAMSDSRTKKVPKGLPQKEFCRLLTKVDMMLPTGCTVKLNHHIEKYHQIAQFVIEREGNDDPDNRIIVDRFRTLSETWDLTDLEDEIEYKINMNLNWLMVKR